MWQKNKKNMFLIFLVMMPRLIFISRLVIIIEEVIVYNFHKKYLDFCKKRLENIQKAKKKHVIDFLTLMPWFIFISFLVVIIEEDIVYNFHKKYLDFCKKKI